jgi:hypothetical protein
VAILASAIALGLEPGDHPARFAASEVSRVPVGPDKDEISSRDCTGSERFCSAGFAFLGLGDTLLFYDPANANLKVIAISGPRAGLVRVITGPREVDGRSEMLDGTMGPGGTIYLLRSIGLPSPRLQVCCRPPGAADWVEGPDIDGGSLGLSPPATSRGASPALWVLLVSLPDGRIALCSQSRMLGQSFLVANRGHLLTRSQCRALEPGIPLTSQRKLVLHDQALTIEDVRGRLRRTLAAEGVYVGTDRGGSIYFANQSSWSRRMLDRYDVEGRHDGSVELPERPVWKPVTGKGDLHVTSGGDVLEIVVSEKWLIVYRWTTNR